MFFTQAASTIFCALRFCSICICTGTFCFCQAFLIRLKRDNFAFCWLKLKIAAFFLFIFGFAFAFRIVLLRFLLFYSCSFFVTKERTKKVPRLGGFYYKNTKFASLRFDFCSCSLINVAKIRCRVLPSVVLHYFFLIDKRTSHDSKLPKVRKQCKQQIKVAKVRIWAKRGIKNLAALIQSNKNFPVSERSEFRGNFYWLRRDACEFFALAINP